MAPSAATPAWKALALAAISDLTASATEEQTAYQARNKQNCGQLNRYTELTDVTTSSQLSLSFVSIPGASFA